MPIPMAHSGDRPWPSVLLKDSMRDDMPPLPPLRPNSGGAEVAHTAAGGRWYIPCAPRAEMEG